MTLLVTSPFRFIWLSLLSFALGTIIAHAQNPFAGNYAGTFFVRNSGVVNLPESSLGAFIATIDAEGIIRNGISQVAGPSIGKVTNSGDVTFSPAFPGSGISAGKIKDGLLTAINTLNFGPLTQVYRLEAAKTGDVGGGSSGGGEAPAPKIRFLTPSAEVNPNSSTSLIVNAVPVTGYQWFKGPKDQATPIDGATNNSYITESITESSVYWVRVDNGGTTTDSDLISFTVKPDPEGWIRINMPIEGATIKGAHGDEIIASKVTSRPQEASVYLSPDRGQTWNLVKEQFETTDVFLDDDLRLFVTRNFLYHESGNDLVKASITPFPGNIGKLVRQDNGNLFFPSVQAKGIFFSSDQGVTWNEVALNGLVPKEKSKYYLGTVGNRLFCGVHPRNAEPIGGLYYSDDNGENWTKSTGIPDSVRGLNQINGLGDKVYATSGGMIHVSSDSGATWTNVVSNLFAEVTTPVDDSQFYWAVNQSLNSFGADLVETTYDGPGASYPFTAPVFYSAPDIIVNINGFGTFRRAIGNSPSPNPGSGSDPSPTPVVTTPTTPPTFNAATGAYEQAIAIQAGNAALPAFELEVRGLPSEVTILNASRRLYGELVNGRRSIEGYAIRYLQELTAGLEIDLNLQYATINGDALPKFTPQVTLNTTSLASIATVPRIVTQRLSRTQASFGFPVTPGKRYQLRSTVNLTDWIVDSEFTAAGNVWEWLAEIQQQAGQLYQLRELTQ